MSCPHYAGGSGPKEMFSVPNVGTDVADARDRFQTNKPPTVTYSYVSTMLYYNNGPRGSFLVKCTEL